MTTAVVPFRPQRVVVPSADKSQAVVSQVRVIKAQAKADREKLLGDLARQWSEVLGKFATSPPMMVLGTCALTNILSQTQSGTYNGQPIYVIEGAISTSLQTMLVTQAALGALVEVAKPALDIAQLIKLIGLI